MRRKNYIGSVTKQCPICNNNFESFLSDNRKYCSSKCYHKSPTKGLRPKNRIKKNCSYCGKEFERAAGNFKKYVKNHFCCHSCSAKWWEEYGLHGKDHPHWVGGYSQKEYRTNWNRIKKDIKQRANAVCEMCRGVHRKMDVHHTIPIRLNIDIKITNHLDNLLYLCRPCHIREDMRLRGGYPNQKETAA